MGAAANPALVRPARLEIVRPEEESLAARVLGWLRRLTGARTAAADAPLRAEARLSLGPKKSLVLVNCCGRRVLLGLSGEAMVALGEWPQTGAKRGCAGRKEPARREAVR
jgi:flagellar biogenesis protein FliO